MLKYALSTGIICAWHDAKPQGNESDNRRTQGTDILAVVSVAAVTLVWSVTELRIEEAHAPHSRCLTPRHCDLALSCIR